MSRSPSRTDFVQGMRQSMPAVVAAVPFGLLYGALAVENGFTVFEAVLMSATIFGGASQMVGIDLFGQAVQPWLIVLSIFAVNFRHVLYSAAVGRRMGNWSAPRKALGFFFLTDPQYAETERKSGGVSFAWYAGLALPLYLCWMIESWIGAMFGSLIPDPHGLGIDFLLPIYFLGLVMSFRGRAMWLPVVAASAIASIIAYLTVGSPWHVSIGAAAGVALAVAMPSDPEPGMAAGKEAESGGKAQAGT